METGDLSPAPGSATRRSGAYRDGTSTRWIRAACSAPFTYKRALLQDAPSGDPYLAFGKQAGGIPNDGTKHSHAAERELYKACALATQYGMGAGSLAVRIDKPIRTAQVLLDVHRQTYKRFWEWSDAAVDCGMLSGSIHTVFGWRLFTGTETNARTLRNFPVQANGAEMLRLACSLMSETGIDVVAPVHDAVLVKAESHVIDDVTLRTQEIMRQASSVVLDGFGLRSDVEVISYPDRFEDKRGVDMWTRIQRLISSDTPQKAVSFSSDTRSVQQ